MDEVGIKAMIIGVSLFITITTLTVIIIYFNIARGIADDVNKRTDIASSFDNIVNGQDFTDELSGVEIRSLINKYAGVENVKINITAIGDTLVNYENINNKYVAQGGWLLRVNEKVSMISEEKLNIIEPVGKCKVDKVENSNIITLEIKLNVKD